MTKLLIVVDYQNDFVDGTLGFPDASNLYPGIKKRIEEYLNSSNEVIYTLDTHFENYLSTQEGRNLPIVHCVKGTRGHELYGDLKEVMKGCRFFEKPTFASLELGEYIKSISSSLESIELCGLVSNICVLSNAVMAKASAPEAKIIVDSHLTASNDPEMNEKVLSILKGIQVEIL